MLTHPTDQRLVALGLAGMAKALEEQRRQPDIAALPFEDRLGLLVDREAIDRENKRLVSRLKFAGLRQNAVVEDVDMKAVRGLDKPLFAKLVAGDWITQHQNLIIVGKTGLGKSWLACALAHKACRDDRSVLYYRVPRLFDALALARGDGRKRRSLILIDAESHLDCRAAHKGIRYPGQHPAIVSAEAFASAAAQLASNCHERKIGRNAKSSSLLAGLLVDANSQKLVATHATKLGKRYRYYISTALHHGDGAKQERALASNGTTAWRYPALEIETIVVREICSLLTDLSRLIEFAKQIESTRSWSMADRSQLGRTASVTAKVLDGNDPASNRAIMLTLIPKIEIGPTTVKIAFNASGLMATLGFPVEPFDPENSEAPHLSIPIAVRRRGAKAKMVLRIGDHEQADPDETMIRAIARARRWMIELVDGVHGSVVQLAAAYATNANYVAKHLPLAFLAPSVVDAILDGRQPVELTTWDLMNSIDIALDWSDQARRLGLP